MVTSEIGTGKDENPATEARASVVDAQVAAVVDAAIKAVGTDRTRLMDIVQAVQQRLGYLPDEAIHAIAQGLGIHGVEVEDMVSFYAFPNREPKGRFHIRLSKTPVSLMKGASEVAQAFADAAGLTIGGTSPDGEFTVD